MLELTAPQWLALCASDERNFVATIRDDIRAANPELAGDPTLLQRLVEAWRAAQKLGMSESQSLVDFLYLEAQAPNFYRHPTIANWLAKPVGTPESRLQDLRSVLSKTLQERAEKT